MKPYLPIACLVLSLVSACADGSGMPAPSPDDDPYSNGAPEPPTRASQSAFSWKGKPGENVEWLAFPATKTLSDGSWGPVLTDIENHLPSQYGTQYRDADKITHGHETSHGIHAHIRNYFNKTGKRANGFYALEDKGVLVVEPNMRKSAVAQFVPASLRGSRYSLYITGQTAWDDTPLYVWDEWNAYVNGGAVGTDLVKRGLWKGGWRDGVNGQLEFTVYAIATAMAVEKNDPTYLETNAQFREFLAWNTRRAMTLYRVGAVMPDFKWAEQDAYYGKMKTSPDAEAWRAFARKLFGTSFTNEVLFGDAVVPEEPDAGPPDAGGGGTPDADPPPPSGGDADQDGVPDALDVCTKTASGANVWTEGEWVGCAGGQRRDAGPWGGADGDGDGITDAKDRCGKTASGARVWTWGEWAGCAAGQLKD